jgi:hypothetical protein
LTCCMSHFVQTMSIHLTCTLVHYQKLENTLNTFQGLVTIKASLHHIITINYLWFKSYYHHPYLQTHLRLEPNMDPNQTPNPFCIGSCS